MKLALPIALVLVLFVAPFGHAAPADSNTDFGAKLVAVMEQMASIVEANKNDCNAMGDKLDRFVTDNAAFFRDVKERAQKMTEEEKKQLEERYSARLQSVIMRLQDGLTKCASNPKVVSALQRLPH